MSECKIIRQYGGSKSIIIRAMIQDNNKERIGKKADEIGAKSKTIMSLIEKEKKLEDKIDVFKKQRDVLYGKISKECKKKGIQRYGSYESKCKGKLFKASDDICWIKEKDIQTLQHASNLWALGKRKEAQIIWDGLITKYKLTIGE